MNPLFTIVVPVYNAGALLEGCLRSVLSQTNGDWELLLIDDGSKDDSLDRCKKFAAADARIRVIHQENRGLAATRNRGIDEALGEYIVFLDNDDALDNTAIEYLSKLVTSSREVNIFVFPLILNDSGTLRNESGRCFETRAGNPFDGKDAFRILFSDPVTRGSYWQSFRFVFKRNYYIDKMFRYCAGLNYEDIEANPRFVLEAQEILLVNHRYYMYTQRRSGSISTGINPCSVADMIVVWDRWYDYFNSHSYPTDIEQGFKSVLARNMWGYLSAVGSFAPQDRKRFEMMFSVRCKRLLMVDQPRSSALFKRLLLRTFGIRVTVRILEVVRHLKRQ